MSHILALLGGVTQLKLCEATMYDDYNTWYNKGLGKTGSNEIESRGDNIKAVIHFFNELKWKLTEKLTEMFKIKAPMEISNRRIHTNFQRDINGGH